MAAVSGIADAKDDTAVMFSRRYEFIPFAGEPNRRFLPMGVIERLFA